MKHAVVLLVKNTLIIPKWVSWGGEIIHQLEYFPSTNKKHRHLPIPSMYGIFTYIWLICMVNVGKCTIHGSGQMEKYFTNLSDFPEIAGVPISHFPYFSPPFGGGEIKLVFSVALSSFDSRWMVWVGNPKFTVSITVPCSCCFPFAVPNAVAPHRMENVASEQGSLGENTIEKFCLSP